MMQIDADNYEHIGIFADQRVSACTCRGVALAKTDLRLNFLCISFPRSVGMHTGDVDGSKLIFSFPERAKRRLTADVMRCIFTIGRYTGGTATTQRKL